VAALVLLISKCPGPYRLNNLNDGLGCLPFIVNVSNSNGNEDFFQHIGQQDITAHVNFSALRQWGDGCGLSCAGLTSQAEFLLALDFKAHLRQQPVANGDIAQLAMQEARLTRTLLVDMGSKFKVLVQQKGVPDRQLTGLRKQADYPPSYKNQSKKLREKAVEIANEVLKTTGNEGEAIATGLKRAREYFAKEKAEEEASK
jgi:hypothetical protein